MSNNEQKSSPHRGKERASAETITTPKSSNQVPNWTRQDPEPQSSAPIPASRQLTSNPKKTLREKKEPQASKTTNRHQERKQGKQGHPHRNQENTKYTAQRKVIISPMVLTSLYFGILAQASINQ